MFELLGVRGRLLLAFLGISAFAVIASVAGLYAFNRVAGFLDHIIQQRVPLATTSLEFSREAERIASSASSLLAARTDAEREAVSTSIETNAATLGELLADLKAQTSQSEINNGLEQAVFLLQRNLGALNSVVSKRRALANEKEKILRKVSRATLGAHRVIDPAIRVMDAKIAQWEKIKLDGASPDLVDEVVSLLPQQKAQVLVASTNDTLIRAAEADTLADLNLLILPLDRNLDSLAAIGENFDLRLQRRFAKQLQSFHDLKASLVDLRRSEFDLDREGEQIIQANASLSADLTALANGVVANAKQAISESRSEALDIQAFSSRVMIATAILTLISSVMITWLYVDRDLVKRIRALSDSMLAIADGNLMAALPTTRGSDEIARMASALAVFRDTAVEVEENNLREVATARQRLIDAIETIGDGFCLYDKDERLVLFNQRYKDGFAGNADAIYEGAAFEDIARAVAESGQLEEAVGREEAWVQERTARHRDPSGETIVSRRADGRWMQISERRTSEGGSVGTFTDVTELKRREAEIAESRARLQAILDHSPVLVFVKDLEGRYVLTNRAYHEFWGSSPDETLGKTDNELYTEEQASAFHTSDQEVLTSRKAVHFEDTQEFNGERRTSVISKFPLIDQAGEVYAVCAITADVTEMKEREEELARTTDRLELALSMDGVGIWDVDLERNQVWWSPQYKRLMGYDPDTFKPTATSWEESLHPEGAAKTITQVEACLEGDQTRLRLPERFVRADGVTIWVDSLMSIRRNAEGRAIRLSGLDVDVTEQLEREQELANANRFIMESLRYASRIQSAMLPAREAIGSANHDHFLIWEPRDIVGGDFFWYHPMQGGYAMIVGDCTGHGVPGAFMTLIACGLLDRMLQGGVDRPSLVLSRLHRDLQALLGQDQEVGETDDGLEAGVCFVSQAEQRLVFAGARFSLFQNADNDFAEIRGDKAGIGYRRFAADTTFNDVTLELNGGSSFYMTTDGLIDQIGGERRRAFGKKRFLACLTECLDEPMSQQAEALRQTFQAYQGDENRRDDVTVLGFVPGAA